MKPTVVLTLPGLYNSGPEHWQSYWERLHPNVRRVEQRDWDTPRCEEWMTVLDDQLQRLGDDVVLAAHSSSCALIAQWSAANPKRCVRGALLVAPSDPEAPSYPSGPTGFAPMPLVRLPFPSVVVASSNDEYVSLTRAREYAHAWNGRFIDLGAAGHINSSSNLGAWDFGWQLIEELKQG
jgi:predicted alpha/beta hydrolase family esterase